MDTFALKAIPLSDRSERPGVAEAGLRNLGFAPGLMQNTHNDIIASLHDAAQIREAQRDIVTQHRQLMQTMVDTYPGVEQDMRARGMLNTNPHLAERLRDAAAAMIPNLDLYVEFEVVQRAWDEFSRRHQEIITFIHGRLRWLFDYWPELFAAFIVYQAVAAKRLADAVPPPGTSTATVD